MLLLPRRSFPPFPADASCRGREGDLRRPCRAAAAGRGMKRKKKARIHKEEGKDTRPQIMPALPCPQTFPFSVSRPLPCRRIFLHYSRPGTAPPAGFPLKRPSNASFTRRTFRCNCRPASFLLPAFRPSLPDKAHPPAPCAGAAMARARRRSRTPGGRTERRSRRGHHPARPGRSAPTPHATRGGRGTAPSKRLLSRYRKKGSTGVQGV